MRRLDDFVPANHPLRRIRVMVNEALVKMDGLFSAMYEADVKGGRPSVAPEKLLRVMLLQILFSIRSGRQLMEQTEYNMLFRWFIGLSMDDAVWVPTVFTKNRERLIEHQAVVVFFNEVLAVAKKKRWLSGERFSVDGTLIQAWAGHKSFVPKGLTTTPALAALEASRARSAATKRTSRRPIPIRGSFAKARRRASCATWATRLPIAATAWLSTRWPRALTATPSERQPR
jgi:transposase